MKTNLTKYLSSKLLLQHLNDNPILSAIPPTQQCAFAYLLPSCYFSGHCGKDLAVLELRNLAFVSGHNLVRAL